MAYLCNNNSYFLKTETIQNYVKLIKQIIDHSKLFSCMCDWNYKKRPLRMYTHLIIVIIVLVSQCHVIAITIKYIGKIVIINDYFMISATIATMARISA